MTIGAKIAWLRTREGLSQERLAEKLQVSRQSVSKWEMEQASPRPDTLCALCDLFRVRADDLLRDEVELEAAVPAAVPAGGKYFGTDGFRGEAGRELTAEHAFRTGQFLGWYYGSTYSGCRERQYRPRFVIGKDTRRSSYMLEYAIASGITSTGGDTYMLHVTSTPSVSYVTRQEGFDGGVMISASHNLFGDNGIKLVNRFGEKLEDATVALIEAYLDGKLPEVLPGAPAELPRAVRERVGAIFDHVAGRNRYMGYLISIVSHSFRGLRIGLDCANGAAWMLAPAIFEALGATVYGIGDRPDGQNINREAGSTHLGQLQTLVREQHLDVGFAFDGDADRCLAVDEAGREVNGDHILYILANQMKRRGILDGGTVVCTVMSNGGLLRALEAVGIRTVQTAVGDRNVHDAMQSGGYLLGGEQSGHIILQKYATTGDGILTALMLMEEMMDRKTTLGKLASPVPIFPQVILNVQVRDRQAAMEDPAVQAQAARASAALQACGGRLLLRRSGTEPVVRVMAEAENGDVCRREAEALAALLRERHGTV